MVASGLGCSSFLLEHGGCHTQSQDLLLLICLIQRKPLTHNQASCPHIDTLELQPFVQKGKKAPSPPCWKEIRYLKV